MHSHNPEDSASTMRYVPHPGSWSAHPEAGYPAFPITVLQEGLSFSVPRLSL